MADQQTPIQGDTQTTPVQVNTQDLLGSISIDLPQAPVEEAVASIAPAGDPASVASPSDTLSADLGSITLPEAPVTQEAAPVEQSPLDLSSISAEPAISTPEIVDALPTIAPQESVAAPAETNTLEAIMAAPLEASVAETPTVTETAPLIIESVPVVSPIEEQAPVAPAPEVVPTTPVEPIADLSPVTTSETNATATTDVMSVNLDSLTSDVAPTTIELPAEVAPVTASVTLPEMTVVSAQHVTPSSSKKKTIAMAGALIVLLAVGAFVFKTMMPDESSKLYASILNIFGASSPAQESILKQPEKIATTSGAIDTLIDREATGSIDTGLAATVAAIESTSGTILSGLNNTGSDLTGTTTIATTHTGATTALSGSMSTEDVQSALTAINEKSKKSLALAKKNDVKDAADRLYKIFKESTNLLETLANATNISTMTDIEQQVKTLQQNLNQAIIILNVSSSSIAQS